MVADKQGNEVTIRLAVHADRAQVASSISDQTGTGSGIGNDDYLLQAFDCMVADPDVLLLFAEDARLQTGLGMMAIAYSSDSESYWKSLRVAEAARQRGIASILFRAAVKAALDRQGPTSVSRWGIVSNNSTMLEWSWRLTLSGPQAFRRHSSTACATTPALPSAYVLRVACEADIPCIMERLPKAVANSVFGAQNFVFVTECEGWAEFSESILRACIAGVKINGIPTPAPRVLFDGKRDPVAFASLAIIHFEGKRMLVHGYADGTPEGLELLISQMPAIAHDYGCDATFGYVPVLPWLLAIFERSPFYTRSTATEQLVFRWKNAEFASTVDHMHN